MCIYECINVILGSMEVFLYTGISIYPIFLFGSVAMFCIKDEHVFCSITCKWRFGLNWNFIYPIFPFGSVAILEVNFV